MSACSTQLRGHRLAATTLTAVAMATAGCAPDAIKYNASSFDAYVKKLGQVCQPLQIGDKDIGEMIRLGTAGTPYDYFLDATSKLYYNRITPAAYRQSVVSFFGPGTSNDRAFDCIIKNLPAVRPSAPD